ncbi:MAG TPA: hypothetical protein VI432_03140 [Candidatus Paceibacterota bacterium]
MHKDLNIILPFLIAIILIGISFSISLIYGDIPGGNLIINYDYEENIPILGSERTINNIFYITLFILLINLLMTWIVYYRERFISYILSYSSVFISSLAFIASIFVYTIN